MVQEKGYFGRAQESTQINCFIKIKPPVEAIDGELEKNCELFQRMTMNIILGTMKYS